MFAGAMTLGSSDDAHKYGLPRVAAGYINPRVDGWMDGWMDEPIDRPIGFLPILSRPM
ncbi:unnamed protein product [Onchocerca ochengi]|uniref:Uncharacterized protein n=1 Tax=Onchocerca ochengi TaxID=42157 RepID=A0A3P7JP14_ONCOC|nr:unnamed protein product [Onchocerca ochengi]